MKIDDDFLSKYVGEKIKYYRRLKGLNQSELGDFLNVKNNTISAYERGVINPDLEQLKKLATILNCQLDDFFPEDHFVFEYVKGTENNLKPDEADTLNLIIEETLKIEESKRADFLDKLSTLVKLYQ